VVPGSGFGISTQLGKLLRLFTFWRVPLSKNVISHGANNQGLKRLELIVTTEEQSAENESKTTSHWVLWTLLALFVVVSIGVMFAADYFYAGDSGASTSPLGAPEN
jgi:hypothetical protein